MEIKYYGAACFSIEDKDVTVVLDPFEPEVGLTLPSLKANVVTVSHHAPVHQAVKAVEGEPRIFSWPGEYETKGVHFRLIHSFHNKEGEAEQMENSITLIHFNGIKFCHLGAQGRMLKEEQIEQMGDVDILFVPVGGNYALTAKEAKKLIESIEPRVAIPMLYAMDGLKLELSPLSAFLSEMSATAVEPIDSFKVKKSELPEDSSKVMVFNPKK